MFDLGNEKVILVTTSGSSIQRLVSASNDRSDLVAERLGEWQKRLLQLDRRNNLLYFKTGRTAVGITDVAPDALHHRLEKSRQGLAFTYAEPPRRRRSRGDQVSEGADVPEEESPPRVIEGELSTDCEPLDLQRRLRNLYRRDREWQEEQGLNILFLAAGFLDWIDLDGEPARAPLVLIPCDLERTSPRDPFRLLQEDDDLVVNPTLRHQLGEMGIELPEFTDELSSNGAAIGAYIRTVGRLVRQRPGWSVDRKLVLSGFTFSKLAMYQDLTHMREHGVRSELTHQLAAGSERTEQSHIPSATPAAAALVGGRLDDLLDVRDQHTVLPADFSQLLAIEQARKGTNLVVHGPPGTGKSQTIANLIATLLADGKRVLFVSEKMAALDVVKRRLEQCGLGTFCLDLHSDRGRKQAVYAQLQAALDDDRTPVSHAVSLDELAESRDKLNSVVQLLHQNREPLDMSVYEVQGHYAPLQDLPGCDEIDVPRASQLDQMWLREAIRRADSVARRQEEFHTHHTNRWRALRTSQQSLQLAEQIQADMSQLRTAIEDLQSVGTTQAEWLGLPSVITADDAARATQLLKLLESAPTVPAQWTKAGALGQLQPTVDVESRHQHERRRLESKLQMWFGENIPDLDFRGIASEVKLTTFEEQSIAAAIGPGWRTVLGTDPQALRQAMDTFLGALAELTDKATGFSQLLGESTLLSTLAELDKALILSEHILQLDLVPAGWLDVRDAEAVARELPKVQKLLDELSAAEERLEEQYSESVLEYVDEDMLVRYRTDHQSGLRRFVSGAFRRDQRVLQGHRKTLGKITLSEALTGVEQVLTVQRLRERWRKTATELEVSLGQRFEGKATDWERVAEDLTMARSIVSRWNGSTSALGGLLAEGSGSRTRSDLVESRSNLLDAIAAFKEAGATINDGRFVSPSQKLETNATVLNYALGPLRRIAQSTETLYERLTNPISGTGQLRDLLNYGIELMQARERYEQLESGLAEKFGSFFDGAETDWNAIESALDWVSRFLDAINGPPSESLLKHATEPQPSDEYKRRYQEANSALQAFREAISKVDVRFDSSPTQWQSWDVAPFDELETWATDLSEHTGEAASWVEYRDAARALDEHLGYGATTALRARTDDAEDVPDIVRRRVFSSWLEEIYTEEPEFRNFTRVDHEEVRARFRRLDQAQPVAARQQVRERVFARYPAQDNIPLQAGQLALLQGEVSKRSRQLSVRNLISRIPNLLLRIKPCFLMSPLAVSQYLTRDPSESEHVQFDTVIFDEASQVWPEEALPAIERAQQVIVAGDGEQLPPSDFFQSTGTSDDDAQGDGDGDDAFEGRESVLDVLVGQRGRNVAESYLKVHYRSRCESLIRFSNGAFYGNQLLTFPGPTADEVCVRDVYLKDATYDAGGSRTNKLEAERVADIVFELMQTTPRNQSIGVVALSRAQSDLIENLIEERRMTERQFDDRFSDDLDEHFFVKNLENVQGDERDHMIFTIGYGPTPAGRVPNRFGPINRKGGERRLNVAVTRARMSMTVVHSLRPEDITAQGDGPRRLREYLEYVRMPMLTPDVEVEEADEAETQTHAALFEDAVLAALTARGHHVERQVGVSGYRIDLAIRSGEGDSYDLGIECDGDTYYSSPAARDRDWLRQQVLEGLGWSVHRVWSTAWIRNPDAEIAAIEDALELARTKVRSEPHITDVKPDVLIQTEDVTPERTIPREPVSRPAAPTIAATLFDEYSHYTHFGPTIDALTVHPYVLSDLIEMIVRKEQPLHTDTLTERLRPALGVKRVGSNIRSRIEQVLKNAIDRSILGYDRGGFLTVPDADMPVHPRKDRDRRIDRISDAEIDEGLLLVARATFGALPDDLVRETSRQFGYRRTGADISNKLEQRIAHLKQSGRLVDQNGMLVASELLDR